MQRICTFPEMREFEKAILKLDELCLQYEIVSPEPGYSAVGLPALVVQEDAYSRLIANSSSSIVFSGWVDFYPSAISVPRCEPTCFDDDVFGACAIMVLAPCVADPKKIRLVAHVSGNLGEVMPYINSTMPQACYNRNATLLTFMDGYRMIAVYKNRITIAKADEIVDAWKTLEKLRCLVNSTWERRADIAPSYEMRKKPPALELYKRLPGTNCAACGEKTCMSFALKLWSGEVRPSLCKPVFGGEFEGLKPALLDICAGLGVGEDPA